MARPKPWFRIHNSIVDNPKIQRLPDNLVRPWLNLVAIANANGGTLPSLVDVAFRMRMSETKCEALIETFLKRVLFDQTDAGIAPHDWNDWQYQSDVSTERVTQFRKRRRNVSVTSDETDQRQSRAETEKTSTEVLARKPRKQKSQVPPDWMPSQQDAAHAAAKGLSAQTISAVAEQFRNHHLAKGSTFSSISAAWRTWIANHINYHGTGPWPRPEAGKPAGNTQARQSLSAALSSLGAKAGLQQGGMSDPLRDVGDNWTSRTDEIAEDFGAIIDADFTVRSAPTSSEIESPDATEPRVNGRSGTVAGRLPGESNGVPSGRGEACIDDAGRREPVVSGVAGATSAAGNPHIPQTDDAGSAHTLDLPAFLKRA